MCFGVHVLGLPLKLGNDRDAILYVLILSIIFGGLGIARPLVNPRAAKWRLVALTNTLIFASFTLYFAVGRAGATLEALDSGYSKCGIYPKDSFLTLALLLDELSPEQLKLHGS